MSKYLVATCPMCGHQLVFDKTAANYTTANVVAAGEAHLATHSLSQWARELQRLQDEVSDQAMLRNMPRCAMPQA